MLNASSSHFDPGADLGRVEISQRSEPPDLILDDPLCCRGFLAKGSGCNSVN